MPDCNYYSANDFVNSKFNKTKNFSIFHLNIHSIQRHIEQLRTLLLLLDFKFDFIAITESKIQTNTIPSVSIDIEGYDTPAFCHTDATKGGVLLYSSSHLNVIPRPDISCYSSKEIESTFIEIINTNSKNDIIGVLYRHHSIDKDTFTNEYLTPLVNKLGSEKNKNIFLTGDFNFNLLNTDCDTNVSKFLDIMTDKLLLPVISLPTRVINSSKSLIDNIFTNVLNPDIISGNIAVGISDHLPSFLIIPKSNVQYIPKKHNLFKRNTKNLNVNNLLNDLNQYNWDNDLKFNDNDVNFSFNKFYDYTMTCIDKHAPLRKLTNKEFKQRYKPWISTGILNSIKRKHSLFKKYINCSDQNQKKHLYGEYKFLRNRINIIINDSKKQHYINFFHDSNTNLRKVWQGIKEIINIKSKNCSVPKCLVEKDKTITVSKDIAENFNSYFSTIASTILEERKYEGNKSFKDFLQSPLLNSLVFDLADEMEVLAIICNIKKNKATGPNSIPTQILHTIRNVISKPLTKLINLSFTQGVHPDKLKISKTIPVFKKGSQLKVSNYRPISLLSNINKIFEKVIFERVYGFLEKFEIIYHHQYGFRKKHSTNHALISITEKIRNALDNNLFAVGVFVDFQKAFDTVNHHILIEKLDHYGIRGCINKWFQSYLSDRKQFVSINGFNSKESNMEHGVPQGSVLGPLLFLLYINDLNLSIKNSLTYHFADDTNLLKIANSYKKIQKSLNIDLKNLVSWLLANKISLNKTKTEVIVFRKPRSPPPTDLKIKLNGLRIQPSSTIKYLGLLLDETLSGDAHCSLIISKLERAKAMLCKIRHYVPQDKLISIYYAIFASHLSYGCQVWGQNQSTSKFNKIVNLQKQAMRIMSFSRKNAHTEPLFKSFKILKLKDQISLYNCLFVHDHSRNLLPNSYSNFFKPCEDMDYSSTRGAAGSMFVPHCSSTTYGRKSVKLSAILQWNHLTQATNTNFLSITKYNLKAKITSHFLETYSSI